MNASRIVDLVDGSKIVDLVDFVLSLDVIFLKVSFWSVAAVASHIELIAVMENYQQKDGSIEIPEALIPYFGKDRIDARK